MKVLIAEDEAVSRRKLEAQLQQWGYDVVTTNDGSQAWQALQEADAPELAVLDWQMPEMCGDEVCRRARAQLGHQPLHIILLTAVRVTKQDMVAGLQAGADDFLVKPADPAELRARLQAGERAVQREKDLMLDLRSRLPQELMICRYCKHVRHGDGPWLAPEQLNAQFPTSRFEHGICPACLAQQLARISLDEV